MTSANDTPTGDFDERLAQALNAALNDGEQLVAQETGDQGQAIALTEARILVVKAGFAATGELDGHKVTAFDLDKVASVNLRKGPLGAVIQVAAEGGAVPTQSGPPDNVIVFTGPGRVKKAEAFVAQVETLSKTQVNRTDPSAKPAPPPLELKEAALSEAVENTEASKPEAPAAPKGGREPRSLAEEIYSEVVEAETAKATPAAAAVPAPDPIVPDDEEEEEEAAEPVGAYRPNPNLPKPPRKQNRGRNGVLVLLGITGGLLLIGMAIMAPLRMAQTESIEIVKTNTAGGEAVRVQLNTVAEYRQQVAGLLARANNEAAAMRSAVQTGSRTNARAIGKAGKTDLALEDITKLTAPPGLAEAKENLVSGLMTQKTAIAAAASVTDFDPMPTRETLARLNEASAKTRKAMAVIAQAEATLQKQAAAAPMAPKSK